MGLIHMPTPTPLPISQFYAQADLDPYELADLRGEMTLYLNKIGTISRSTASEQPATPGQSSLDNRTGRTISSQRQPTQPVYQSQQSIRCCVSHWPGKPSEELTAEQPTEIEKWLISMPYDTDVRIRDEIVVDTIIYVVDDTDADRSDILLLSVYCTKRDYGR